MFTLQILDRGQTFLFPVGDQPLVLGSHSADDVQIGERGVGARHVRIVPAGPGLRLEANGPVAVNGSPVTGAAELALGDRIEFGCAVVVVGRQVARPARPEDVLATPATRRARPPRAAGRPGATRWLPIGAAVVLLAVVVAFAMRGGGDAGLVQGELAYLARLRDEGRVDRAAEMVARLQREWQGATDGRLGRLAAEEAQLDAIETERQRIAAEVRDDPAARGLTEWTRELLRLEAEGQPPVRSAARLVRSRLAEILLERPAVAAPSPATPSPAVVRAPAVVSAPVPPVTPTPVVDRVDAPAAAPAVALADIERLAAAGEFVAAWSLVQAGLEAAQDPAAVAALREAGESVLARAREHLRTVLAAATAHERAGRLDEALAGLEAARGTLPARADFSPLSDAIRRLRGIAAERAAAATSPLPPQSGNSEPALHELRQRLAAADDAEQSGAWAEAATLLRALAGDLRDVDAATAQRCAARAEEADMLAAWHAAVGRQLAQGEPLKLPGGRSLRASPTGIEFVDVSEDAVPATSPVVWGELDAASLAAVAEQVAPLGHAALGAAVLLYRADAAADAERWLLRTWRAAAELRPAVEGVLARGRGEPVEPGGYQVVKDEFVSQRSLERQRAVQQMARRVERAFQDGDDSLFAEGLDGDREMQAVVAAALRRELDRQITRVEGAAFRRSLEKLEALRQQLEDARAHAKELIFDEVTYFYPFKPPAVSGEKHAEYNRVQAEVNRRVGLVKAIWQDTRIKVRVPATLSKDLERIDWAVAGLARLGESTAAIGARLDWARALPHGEVAGIQEHCRTAAERAERDEWSRVLRYNERVAGRFTPQQRALLRIVNDYRVMFGHRPLAIVDSIAQAAQGHADEMQRLGYFAHMSPTPELRTPHDRMRRAGYEFGVSENIALVDGALPAHTAWCHSAGHHRNLLQPSHRELGVGAAGRYWVLNFGGGDVHRQGADWAELSGR
jgi:hypothetical protein